MLIPALEGDKMGCILGRMPVHRVAVSFFLSKGLVLHTFDGKAEICLLLDSHVKVWRNLYAYCNNSHFKKYSWPFVMVGVRGAGPPWCGETFSPRGPFGRQNEKKRNGKKSNWIPFADHTTYQNCYGESRVTVCSIFRGNTVKQRLFLWLSCD